ncbi:MAG: DUF3422 domain-containing protein [Methylocystis sp.]
MPETASSGPMIEHESRAAILAELHARPFVPLEIPRRVYHFAFATNEDEAHADREEIERLASSHDCSASASDAKFKTMTIGCWDLRWEQHTEFTTYTWSTSKDATEPFSHPNPLVAGEIGFRAPGRLIVAAHLCVVGREHALHKLAALFNSQSLCVIGAAKGAAHVLTDFALDSFGFTRLIIRSNDASALEAGRLAQRALEVETYRTLALLGLPEARRASPELRAMEREVSGITHALSRMQDARTNEDLLRRLSDLLAAGEALSTRTAFRFGASRAYHALVKNRLELLQEAKESQYVTISNFLSARLDPAIETCNAVEARQARLSNQVERAINLMRTGITFELERQNRDLLHDMNRRARLQMRLQRTVQGLSVAALAYYLLGLTAFVTKGVKDAGWLPAAMTADEVTALALPFTFLASWLFMERVRRLSLKAAKEEQVD